VLNALSFIKISIPLMQKGLKSLKVLSIGDKTERAENLYAQSRQDGTCCHRQATAVFRIMQ
jgi:hypothetical protein